MGQISQMGAVTVARCHLKGNVADLRKVKGEEDAHFQRRRDNRLEKDAEQLDKRSGDKGQMHGYFGRPGEKRNMYTTYT